MNDLMSEAHIQWEYKQDDSKTEIIEWARASFLRAQQTMSASGILCLRFEPEEFEDQKGRLLNRGELLFLRDYLAEQGMRLKGNNVEGYYALYDARKWPPDE